MTITTSRPRRGAAPFTTTDLETGEELGRMGQILWNECTIRRGRDAIYVAAPGIGWITTSSLAGARKVARNLHADQAANAAERNAKWEASLERSRNLNEGFMKSGR